MRIRAGDDLAPPGNPHDAHASPHEWQFFRAGGVDQVVLRSGTDIARIGELDQKLWVALACPTRGIEFDPRTLDLIDTDHDGRIRAPELIAACEWACAQLADPQVLLAGGDTLALDAFAPPADDGADLSLAAEARRVLEDIGRPGEGAIALADVLARSERLAAMRFNGDGVVTPATATDAAVRHTVQRIIETHGAVQDRNGEDGIDRGRAAAFFAEGAAVQAWRDGDGARACREGGLLRAAQAVQAVHEKVDDFFARCRLAAYDAQAVAALNAPPEAYEALAGQALTPHSAGIVALPLAPIAPNRALRLTEGVNPAWADALKELRDEAVRPILGPTMQALDEAGWHLLCERVAPCGAWLAARPATALAEWDPKDIEAAMQTQAGVMTLIEEDERIEPHNMRLVELEKLLRLQRDLVTLLRNFVSFRAFYRREGAIFQAGTLYLDGRSCELTVRVDDVKQHATLAGMARTCLAYCECRRGDDRMHVVAAITAGDIDFLFPGRNGVFYDRQGRDWDATITQLIENPTSVAQAFFSPYKKFVRLIEEQVAKRAAASEARAQGALGTLAANVATADQPVATDGTPATTGRLPGSRVDVGTVAAIGVALGSISAMLVALFGKFVELGPWIPIGVVGVVLAISGPSMLIAWLKLRQRGLGPILDASGWAINGRMKVNTRLGASLSRIAHVSPRARLRMRDPYAPHHRWPAMIALALLAVALATLAWRSSVLDAGLPPRLQHAPEVPSAVPPAAIPADPAGTMP